MKVAEKTTYSNVTAVQQGNDVCERETVELTVGGWRRGNLKKEVRGDIVSPPNIDSFSL